jgi:tetratricopeptide (TPR) repeat protein
MIGLTAWGCVPATISAPRGQEHLAAMRQATTHYHHGRIDEAASSYGEAARTAERRVDRDEAEYRQARSLVRLERREEAIVMLDAIARRRPISRRTVRARFDAALIRRELGREAEAQEAFRWIIETRPGDGPAGRSLVLHLASYPDDRARITFLRELYDRVGESDLGDDILFLAAELHVAASERAEAIALFERLVHDHPYPHGQRWDDTLFRLADLADDAGDHVLAIAHLRRILEFYEPTVVPGSQTLPRMPEARMRIARTYRDHLRDWVRAAEEFRAVYRQFTTSLLRDDALYELGVMWLDAGERAEGCSALRQVADEFEVGHARRLAARRIEEDCRE